MTQAFNLSQFANKVNSSGQADASTGFTGTISTSNLPTVPTTKGGTGLTSVGSAGQVLKSDGTNLSWGNVAGTIAWQSVQTTSFTATSNYGYPVNTTSGAITVTLPASPTAGDMISIIDYAGTAATNNIILNRNGNKIEGGTINKSIQTNREGLTIVYADATQGWVSVSDVYSTTPYINQPYSASYLVVAGGGGGGGTISSRQYPGAGGGAGGLLTGTVNLIIGVVYTVTVGAGGATANEGSYNGSNSVLSGSGITTQTSIGGGAGAYDQNQAGSGGSGGGASYSSLYGSGTAGQGYAGGTGTTGVTSGQGGGGGASAVGANGSSAGNGTGGNGGAGTASSITGSSITYAGGGGGSCYSASGTAGTGGAGGGGNGGKATTSGTAGTANLGGGGGGSGGQNYTSTGNGGSGVVILSVPTANYSGTTTGSPTVTTSGSNTIIKFTASGTYTA